jgi:predicted thioesterase
MPRRPEPGEEVVHEVEVTPEMTARLFDREIHPLYATAWLVRHAEEAGRLIIERHLGPNEDATGYRIEVTHEGPARVGDRLEVRARVTEVDDRSCTVEFEVTGPNGLVGTGTFVQRYVARDA